MSQYPYKDKNFKQSFVPSRLSISYVIHFLQAPLQADGSWTFLFSIQTLDTINKLSLSKITLSNRVILLPGLFGIRFRWSFERSEKNIVNLFVLKQILVGKFWTWSLYTNLLKIKSAAWIQLLVEDKKIKANTSTCFNNSKIKEKLDEKFFFAEFCCNTTTLN